MPASARPRVMLIASPLRSALRRREGRIALGALGGIALHLALRYGGMGGAVFGVRADLVPLLLALALGLPLLGGLARHLRHLEFNADLLAGLSIVTAVLLGEYLAGTVVVLMLSGGQALEAFAVQRASSALEALARRMPAQAHRKTAGRVEEVPLEALAVGDLVVVYPHETCPVDGVVVEGHGAMNEAYLTGEPYVLAKAVGAAVLSGAINGETVLTIRAEKKAADSRYAQIMQVMRASEQQRPRLRRLGDQLGAVYTPVAVGLALVAWLVSGDATRFLAVLVVATPCPLLIAIPVALISAISLAARRGIVIRDPVVLERLPLCRTAIFDKTGTLTYGVPTLTDVLPGAGFEAAEVLSLVASLEVYSRHPLAGAVVAAAKAARHPLQEASEVSERPGQGLQGQIGGRRVEVTGRARVLQRWPDLAAALPPSEGGLEGLALVDGRYAATLRFRDEPRPEGTSFVQHLRPRHGFARLLLVTGDRESEARRLAARVGITEVYAAQTPEQKLELVRRETRHAPTVFLGDGINDAPALAAATVGIAFGQANDVTTEAAGAVVLDSNLGRVDELLHIGRRMRRIALQSAVGGMALSVAGMLVAAAGLLPPVAGALTQEAIDVLTVLNALRVALASGARPDYSTAPSPPLPAGPRPALAA